MSLIEFLKIELGQMFVFKKILDTPDYVAGRLKHRINSKDILLWTKHFAQQRNADISQAFTGFTAHPARVTQIPNTNKKILQQFESKYQVDYPLFGDLPALIVKGGGTHKDFFLMGCIEVVLLKPIEQIFTNSYKQGKPYPPIQPKRELWAEIDADSEGEFVDHHQQQEKIVEQVGATAHTRNYRAYSRLSRYSPLSRILAVNGHNRNY